MLAMRSGMKRGAGFFVVFALSISVFTIVAARGCVRVPQSIPGDRLVTSDTKLTVPVPRDRL